MKPKNLKFFTFGLNTISTNKQMKFFKLFCLLFFVSGLMLLNSTEAKAQRINVNDGYIEYIKYSPNAIEIKMTVPKGIDYGSAFMNARELAKRVQARRPNAYRIWPPININKLAVQIQAHALAYSVRIKRDHANPVNVNWTEVT